jgi:hypothetical protein
LLEDDVPLCMMHFCEGFLPDVAAIHNYGGWFCLFIYLWVLTFPLLDCSEFGNFFITLMKMTFQEIRIIATGPCIANQLRDVLFLYSYESEFLQNGTTSILTT